MGKAEKNLGGHPVTTGSDSVRPISFRLAADEHRQLQTLANSEGTTRDDLARRAVRGYLRNEMAKAGGVEETPAPATNVVKRVKGARG